MAEEEAFPYSKWLATLHPRAGIPWNLMLVVFVVEIAVGMITTLSFFFFPLLQRIYVLTVDIRTYCSGK